MKFRIEERDGGLSVHIDDIAGREQALVDAIRTCRTSAWACPSGECMNIAHIAERVEQGTLILALTPRPAARLDARGIEQCLRYMLADEAKARA